MTLAPTSSGPEVTSQQVLDIARLLTVQGALSESDYLALDTNWLVEFTDGYIEVLPMPKMPHQRIVGYLIGCINAFIKPAKLGEALFAPMRVRLGPGLFREPDVLFMLTDHASRKTNDFWEGADLIIEVVSDDWKSHLRDFEQKRGDYAKAHIPEYWIVDPREQRITVLKLEGDTYAIHGEFTTGTQATSVILDGFSVNVESVFAAANG